MEDRDKIVRQWGDKYLDNNDEKDDPVLYAVAEYVVCTTDPLTMADAKWDDDMHFLAGATSSQEDEFVMLSTWGEDEILASPPDDSRKGYGLSASDLTPNGKRYELREITEPEHPEFLETVDDYYNAPDGTIIVDSIGCPYVKRDRLWWVGTFRHEAKDMARIEKCRVLLWGKK